MTNTVDIYELTIDRMKDLMEIEDTNVATASQGYLTICFDDRSGGWTSVLEVLNKKVVLSLNNTYYTFSSGKLMATS